MTGRFDFKSLLFLGEIFPNKLWNVIMYTWLQCYRWVMSELVGRECRAGELTVTFICYSEHTCTHAHAHAHTLMHTYAHIHKRHWSWRKKILRKCLRGIIIPKQARSVSLRGQWWAVNLCSFQQTFLSHESEFSVWKEHFSILCHMAFSFDFIRQKRLTFAYSFERADSDLIELTGTIMTGARGHWSE